MAYTIVWSRDALKDFEDTVEFIAKDSQYYAQSFAQEVWSKSLSLSHFPHRGATVPETKPILLKEIFISRYRLIYEIEKERVSILAFIHGSRNFQKVWKKRKKK